METVVIPIGELAHYAESTARTMPVTGVVPRTVAEDMLRYALRSLRAAARRLEEMCIRDRDWSCRRRTGTRRRCSGSRPWGSARRE